MCVADRATLEPRDGFALATVMARKGVDPAAIGTALDMVIADGPVASTGGGLVMLGTGPGSWLAFRDVATGPWPADVRGKLDGLASVSDQSGGYALFHLSGPGARTVLQRGAAIDFDASVFRPGSVATTVIAHIGVIIWQVDDSPAYMIALFRSFAGSFRHWCDVTMKGLEF